MTGHSYEVYVQNLQSRTYGCRDDQVLRNRLIQYFLIVGHHDLWKVWFNFGKQTWVKVTSWPERVDQIMQL